MAWFKGISKHKVLLLTVLLAGRLSLADKGDLELAIVRAFGVKADEVSKTLAAKKIPEGQNPEALIQAGDTLIFAQMDTAFHVPLYTPALQGFNHAAIVGRDSNGDLFQSFVPSADTACIKSFRGAKPYIIIRPKKSVIKARDFGAEVTRMLNQMSLIGYDYDDKFDTEVLSMSPSSRGKFHAGLMSYAPGDVKPPMPKMYCSEVPVTVYTLLGIRPKAAITGGAMIDIGLNESFQSGKPKEIAIAEAAAAFIGTMRAAFSFMTEEAQKEWEELKRQKTIDAKAQAKLEAQIQSYKTLVAQLDTNQELLEDYLRSRIGLCQKHSSNDTLKSVMKSLAFYFANEKPVVRPVDLLREALSPEGNFEVVGVYQGGGSSPCF